MRSRAIFVSLLAMSVIFVGCSTMVVPGAEITPKGTIMFSAEGSAAVMKADDAMALMEARTTAATLAKANLLEKIKGAIITSHVQVKDLAFAAETATIASEGMLARVNLMYKPMERTGPMAMVVTAVASLEMTKEQLMGKRRERVR